MNEQSLPHDIYSIITITPSTPYLLIALGVILTLALLLFWFLKWRRKQKPQLVPHPFLTLEGQIAALNPPPFFESKAQAGQYFFQLSMAVRALLEALTGLPLTDKTTREIKAMLEQKALQIALDPEVFLHFLNRADQIKFAKEYNLHQAHDEAIADHRYSLELAKQFRPLHLEKVYQLPAQEGLFVLNSDKTWAPFAFTPDHGKGQP